MQENGNAMRAMRQKWKRENREKVRAANRAYTKAKYQGDEQFRAKMKAYAASQARREVLNARARERYKNDPVYREKQKTWRREYNRAHREERLAYVKAWRLRNPEQREEYRLQYCYGISLSEYAEMLIAQGGVCLLCQKAPTEKRFAVDHDHATGRVRGLVHRSCNAILAGVFGDDPEAMRRAAERFMGRV